MSSDFSKFFEKFFDAFFRYLMVWRSLRDSLHIIPHLFLFVNEIFKVFSIFFDFF